MIKIISSLILAVFLLASCRPIKDPVFNGIENVRVNNIGIGQSSVTLDMSYSNPNNFKARLRSAEGDAWMDSTFLGHFVVDSAVDIPAGTNFIVPVNLSIDMKMLLEHSLSAFLNKQVLIRIKGTGKAGRNGVYRNFNLNYEGRQDLSKIFNKL